MLQKSLKSAKNNGLKPMVAHRPALTTRRKDRPMAAKPLPSPEMLRQLLRYEPETGKLFWKERDISMFSGDGKRTQDQVCRCWNTRFAGQEAGAINHGYIKITISGAKRPAHRIAWAIHFNSWPEGQIDHISGDGTDNRIANLRDVSPSVNGRNKATGSNNSSGVVGVHWDRVNNVWQSQISHHGKRVYLGRYKNKDAAVSARKAAEEKFNYHENHGRRV